ncbi:MAG TPA: MFS transporter [Candidatus Nitrosotalea sp.]|nr:MFS transporter [Candidatus Nitrosotalea sp.]
MVSPSPHGRQAARVLVAGLVLQLAFGLVFAWGSVVPYVRAEWHWPPLLLGAVFSGTPFGFGIGTLLGGRLADRIPARRLCWAGMALLAVGFSVAFIAPSGVTFVVFYSALGLGLGGGVALTGAVAAATQVMPQRVGSLGGALTAAYATAVVFEAPLIAVLTPHIGWFNALRLVGVGMGLVAALILLFMPRLPPARHATAARPANQFQLLRRPAVWTSTLMLFSSADLGSYAAVDLVSHARADHLAVWIGTAALVGLALANIASRIVSGFATDRFGVDPVMGAVLCMVLLAAGIMVVAGSTEAGILAAGVSAGIPVGGGPGLMSKLASVSAPDAPNSVFGIFFAGFASGSLLGPLIGEPLGGSAAWIAVAAPAIGGLVLLQVRSRLRRAGRL